MHEVIRHLHPLLAVISVLIFNYKFWKTYTNYDFIISHRSRVASRVIDVLLLVTGIILAFGITGIVADVGWFKLKLLFVVFYIIMGILCLKVERGTQKSLVYYLLAMACVVTVVGLVKLKPF